MPCTHRETLNLRGADEVFLTGDFGSRDFGLVPNGFFISPAPSSNSSLKSYTDISFGDSGFGSFSFSLGGRFPSSKQSV